jgi:hypothetical protein
VNTIEELLRQEREAGVPEPPDRRYTMARLKVRMGRTPPAARRDDGALYLAVAAAATLVGAALLALLRGASPWWLLAVPLSALLLGPILIRKGAPRA